jgi:GT2 family glycosyltransferase
MFEACGSDSKPEVNQFMETTSESIGGSIGKEGLRQMLEPSTPQRTDTSVSADLVSVIVPCIGQIEYTKLSLPRLLRLCREPFEVIVSWVASLDGTADYVAGLSAAAPARVRTLAVTGSEGNSEACAMAASLAGGKFVALVANDALVSEGWLGHLTALARLAPDIGMVGCMSNLAPPPQWVGQLPYRLGRRTRTAAVGLPNNAGAEFDTSDVDHFAKEWREKNRGQSIEVERLGGPCFLLKADVLKRIKLEAARGPVGSIDADLLSRWVREAGYRLACARDVFVHHFGSRPFGALRFDPQMPLVPGDSPITARAGG